MRPPVPPFTEETARAKVQAAEDAWNTRDPERVAAAYTEDSQWRNRDEFFVGRAAIVSVISATTASLEFVFQTVHAGLVRVDGDRASARFPVTEWSRRKRDGVTMLFLGLYEDDVVRTGEGWRFARRELVPRTLGKAELFTGRIHDPALRPTL